MSVVLFCDNNPVGKIAPISLSCADRFVSDVACKYLFVTLRLLWRRQHGMMKMKEKSELGRAATILGRELEPTIQEWLRRVNLVPELTNIPLSDADRAGHLLKLYSDLIFRLWLPKDATRPISVAAAAHGQRRREQGYSAAMLIAESRIFQVVTFRTLHLYHSELDQRRLLLDVMVIADEADAQLMGAVCSLTAKGTPTPQ